MKRQQIVLIVCGVALAAVCAVAGWFLFSAIGVKNQMAEDRNSKYAQLQKIYRAKVFPNDENIGQVLEDEKALQQWLVTASNLVHTGDLQIRDESPARFKQSLTETTRALSRHPGSIKGKTVADDFKFGFDRYLGNEQTLPQQENVGRLVQQLDIIDQICQQLFAANILALKGITREVFEEDQKEEEAAPEPSRRRRRRPSSAKDEPVKKQPEGSEYTSRQRFTFAFDARPAAFIESLNKLAAMDLFVVVSEVSFSKTGDQLKSSQESKRDADGGPAKQVDPATLKHMERIVTDPELEPPISVTLVIDVYAFEGV